MSISQLPDKYRALEKTDIVEIRRNPENKYDSEPTSISAVIDFLKLLTSSNSKRLVPSTKI